MSLAKVAKIFLCVMFTATSLKNVHYLDALTVSGIGLGRDLFPETPTETCVAVYRARYSYYLILVAGTTLQLPLLNYSRYVTWNEATV